MEEKVIKISEDELKRIIKESVREVLSEGITEPLKISDYFDISKITPKQIKSITTDMRIYLYSIGFGYPIFYDGKKIITEALYKTVPVDDLFQELNKIGFKKWQVASKTVCNKVKIAILYVDIALNTDTVIKEMEAFGWTKSMISNPEMICGTLCRAIEFEPGEQESMKDEAKGFEYLYHITPFQNVTNILTYGLEVRTENTMFDYPPRVHLIKGNTPKNIISYLGWQLYFKNNNQIDGKYGIIRIKTSEIPNNIDIYGDSRFEYGFIIKDSIPPQGMEYYGYVEYTDKYRFNNEPIIVEVKTDESKN